MEIGQRSRNLPLLTHLCKLDPKGIGFYLRLGHFPGFCWETEDHWQMQLVMMSILTLCCHQVCYALSQLAAGFKESESTSLLSPYFKDIVRALLDAVRYGYVFSFSCMVGRII